MECHARPTGQRINPSAPEGAFYFDAGQTHYILDIAGKLRDYTSFGTLRIAVGDRVEMRHDEGRRLGTAKVIGIRHYDGSWVGEIPAKAIPHWVAK